MGDRTEAAVAYKAERDELKVQVDGCLMQLASLEAVLAKEREERGKESGNAVLVVANLNEKIAKLEAEVASILADKAALMVDNKALRELAGGLLGEYVALITLWRVDDHPAPDPLLARAAALGVTCR